MRRSGSLSRSWPSSSTSPPTIRPGGLGIRRRIESAVTLLPLPLLADDAQHLALGEVEAHVLDRGELAVLAAEGRAQAAHAQERRPRPSVRHDAAVPRACMLLIRTRRGLRWQPVTVHLIPAAMQAARAGPEAGRPRVVRPNRRASSALLTSLAMRGTSQHRKPVGQTARSARQSLSRCRADGSWHRLAGGESAPPTRLSASGALEAHRFRPRPDSRSLRQLSGQAASAWEIAPVVVRLKDYGVGPASRSRATSGPGLS